MSHTTTRGHVHLRELGFRKPHTHIYHHAKAQKRCSPCRIVMDSHPANTWFSCFFSKFGQNHIFGLYGKTRYFKQLHLIQNVLRHSKTTFPWLSSHVVWFAVSILYLTHNMCKENVFWPIFGPKLGHFGGHFEFYGSNLKNDFKNEFLDPKYILKHRSHLIFWLLFLFLWLF